MNMIGYPHRLLADHTDLSLRLEPVLLLGWGTLFLSRHVCFFSLLSFLPPAYTSCQGKFPVLDMTSYPTESSRFVRLFQKCIDKKQNLSNYLLFEEQLYLYQHQSVEHSILPQ